jgi:phytoene dehydrogenase-like protein
MRQLGVTEPFDRLAVFFKNLSLGEEGAMLPGVEAEVKQQILEYIENPEDCAWTRLLTPRDMQRLFHFPGGNLDHTMLAEGQTFSDRQYSDDPARHFYNFGSEPNVFMCGAGTYPCGSVAGTPGYMCARQIIRSNRLEN